MPLSPLGVNMTKKIQNEVYWIENEKILWVVSTQISNFGLAKPDLLLGDGSLNK